MPTSGCGKARYGQFLQAPSIPYSSRQKRRGRCGSGKRNSRWNTTPATKPPTCAQKAIPPTSDAVRPAIVPLSTWLRNQKRRYMTAGSSEEEGEEEDRDHD